jgi:hypothetical protein
MIVNSGEATGRLTLAGIALEATVYGKNICLLPARVYKLISISRIGLFAIFSLVLIVYLFGNIGIKRRFIYIGFIVLSLMLATAVRPLPLKPQKCHNSKTSFST